MPSIVRPIRNVPNLLQTQHLPQRLKMLLPSQAGVSNGEPSGMGDVPEGPISWPTLKNLYDKLKASKFDLNCIASLESSQLLERCLWPQFPPSDLEVQNSEEASEWDFLGAGGTEQKMDHLKLEKVKYWILFIASLINEKFRQRIEVWTTLGLDQSDDESNFRRFRLFFYLAWFIFLRPDRFSLSMRESAGLLQLFIHVYQSLEQGLIRRACMPMCGLPTWTRLGSKQLDRLFNSRPELSPLWKVVHKRYRGLSKRCGSTAEFDSQGLMLTDRFCLLERDALHEALIQFVKLVEDTLPKKIDIKNLRPNTTDETNGSVDTSMVDNLSDVEASTIVSEIRNENPDDLSSDDFLYCERFLELLIDLLSQLPTRRIIRPVLSSHQVLPRLRLSPLFRHSESALIRQLTEIAATFDAFEIDDSTGEPMNNKELEMRHYEQLKDMQLIFFEHFQHIPELKEVCLKCRVMID